MTAISPKPWFFTVALLLLFATAPSLPAIESPLSGPASSPAETASGTPTEYTGPQEVKIGFYLLSGGKLDFQNAQIPLDFYLWLVFKGDDKPKFEFLNSKNAVINLLNDEKIGTESMHYLGYRVYGSFDQEFDLKNYPFDLYKIRVTLEDTSANSIQRVYIPDTKNSAMDSHFSISGCRIDQFELISKPHRYDTNFGDPNTIPEQNSYSRVEANLSLSRFNAIIFIKNVTPSILFLLISLVGIVLPIEQIGQRISLCVGALFSSVAYHINIMQGLPPLAYLTFADKMMIGNYILVFVNILFCIAIFTANRRECPFLESVLSKFARIALPACAFCGYGGIAYYFLF